MNIFELTNLQKDLKEWLEKFNNLEIDEETLKKHLMITEQTKEQYTDKIKNYYYLVKHYQSFVDSAKAEKDRISQIQKTYENVAKNLKYIMKESMELLNEQKIEFDTGKVYLKNNPDKLEIDMAGANDIPMKYKTIQDPIINKKVINDEFKKVEELPPWLKRKTSEKSIVLK